ncbi:MAG: hypothetical protein BGP06_19285 [Rhizobiales bacterium 65-9]|nr:MAG: hypothetical protein BGP06_19285 [Rhizobiales bacterium 65-9]
MTIDATVLLAIIVMGAVTYLTRVVGFLLPSTLALSPRAQAAFDAIPPAVLVAVIAPTALATGWRETLAALICVAAAARLPLLGVVGVGVVAIVALRAIG